MHKGDLRHGLFGMMDLRIMTPRELYLVAWLRQGGFVV